MSHWRQKSEEIEDRKALYDALAEMLFYIIMVTPFLAVWLGYIVWKAL